MDWATLETVGRALFGEHWLSPIALLLELDLRRLQRASRGHERLPDLTDDLMAVCDWYAGLRRRRAARLASHAMSETARTRHARELAGAEAADKAKALLLAERARRGDVERTAE